MSNTVVTTNRTIEVSGIDSDYMMPIKTNVESVVFIPGINFKAVNYVDIIENTMSPVKVKLIDSVNGTEARTWMFNQRLQLGFVFADCYLDAWCKVIFNIGELHYSNRVTNVRVSSFNTRMLMKLKAGDAVIVA